MPRGTLENKRRLRLRNNRRQAHDPSFSSSLASFALSTVKRSIGVASLVVLAEVLYVGLTTPRLPPPPPLASKDEETDDDEGNTHKITVTAEFPTEISKETNNDERNDNDNDGDIGNDSDRCFRLVFLGDSPVEGIGNPTHEEALVGRTAAAFSRRLGRCWSVRTLFFGKSGLTARGVKDEMVPRWAEEEKRIRLRSQSRSQDDDSDDDEGIVDLVVLSCGVNDVLWGRSTAAFGRDLALLLEEISVVIPKQDQVQDVVVLGLLDFSLMPFLPWPLNQVLGWRSRALQEEMDRVVQHHNDERCGGPHVAVAHIPRSITSLDDRTELQKYLVGSVSAHDKNVLANLTVNDFFADDGFHPAKYGTSLLGELIAQTYMDMIESNNTAAD